MWKINKKLLVFCAVVVILISAVRVASAHNRFEDKEKENDSAESHDIVKYGNPIDEYGKSLELVSRLDTDTPGIGLYAYIMRVQGELYREYSIHMIESYGDEDSYIYMDRDYSEIIIP